MSSLRDGLRAILEDPSISDIDTALDALEHEVIQPELAAKDAEILRLHNAWADAKQGNDERLLNMVNANAELVTRLERAESRLVRYWLAWESARIHRRSARILARELRRQVSHAQKSAKRAEVERDRLARLVDEALAIRRYGQRAPGGTENWGDWDRQADAERRAALELKEQT